MAYIQNTIIDLDDLLIQATDIDDNGTTSITITTAAAHGLVATDTFVIAGASNSALNGLYTADAGTTGTTIVTTTSSGTSVSNGTGKVIGDDTLGVYSTPEITVNCSTKKFFFKGAGNLFSDGSGVTGQALYSFYKYLWKNVQSITKFDFPMLSITNEQFEFINDWEPDDTQVVAQDNSFNATTRKMLRTCGWSEIDNASAVKQRWFGFISLGTIGLTDQPYYVQQAGFESTTTNTDYTGPANEAIQFFGDATHGNIDYTGINSYYKVYVRTRGKTYTTSQLSDIGVSESTYIVYRFPLSNGNDLNIATGNDNAFSGAAIASITSDGTIWTVTTSVAHGLYVGAPILISGSTGGVYDGTFTVASITGDVSTSTELTISNTNNFTDQAGAAGTTSFGYSDVMKLNYLENPYTNSGSVVIKGDYLDTNTYDPGDVVIDSTGGGRWFYLNQAGTSTGGTDDTIANSSGTWAAWTDGERNIEDDASTYSGYSVVFEMNNNAGTAGATKEAAYEYAQYLLRQASDINDSSTNNGGNSDPRNGNIADTIVYFVGSQLHTNADSSIPFAVVLDDIADADLNNVTYHEALIVAGRSNDTHLAPLVVLVSINFNSNLYEDANSVFYAYYKTGEGAQTGNDFGTAGALQLVDNQGDPVGETIKAGMTIPYEVPSTGQYNFSYSYTSDTTNGRTGGDVAIVVVSIGLDQGQYVSSEGVITSSGGSVSLVAPLERNYSNP